MFGLGFAVLFVFMLDAIGVSRAVGKHAAILICTEIIFLAGYPIGKFNTWAAIILTGVFCHWFVRQYFRKIFKKLPAYF